MTSILATQLMQATASIKNEVIAQAIGHDAAHVCRITSGERGIKIGELEAYLKALGMKAIKCEGEIVSIPKSEHEALKILARKGLEV